MEETKEIKASTAEKKNGAGSLLSNLLFNIVLPVLILNKMPKMDLDIPNLPAVALILALSFPVGYFIWDYLKTRKTNFISILGFISVLATGVIGLLNIPNEWLAVKEASVPAIIMLILLGSLYTGHPVIEILLYTDDLFDKDRISLIAREKNAEGELSKIMKRATLIVAASFLLSTVLNYVLAKVLVTADPVTETVLREQQMGDMILWSYVFISLPCMVVMCLAMWYLFNRLSRLTGLETEQLMAPQLQEKMKE